MLGRDTMLRRELSIFLCPWNLHHFYALLLGATKYIILAPVRQWEVFFSCMDFEPSKFWMLCDRNFLPKKGLQHSCGYLKKQYWAIQWLHFVIDWHPFVEFLQRVVAWRYASVALETCIVNFTCLFSEWMFDLWLFKPFLDLFSFSLLFRIGSPLFLQLYLTWTCVVLICIFVCKRYYVFFLSFFSFLWAEFSTGYMWGFLNPQTSFL